MKLKQAIESLGIKESTAIAKEIAVNLNIQWNDSAEFVFMAITKDLERAPGNVGSEKDSAREAIKKWLVKYQSGKKGRASQRTSRLPSTVSDPIIDVIISGRIPKLDKDDLLKIKYAHRLGMSAENILGLILEEYLSVNLEPHGWHCAWGETVKSVDFVHKDGRLLQIKNRSNSENSSSSKVRQGTKIEKWYRIQATKVEFKWEALNQICETPNLLSEDSFAKFVKATLRNNPSCLAVESGNPWVK